MLKSIRNKLRVARQFNLRVKARPLHVRDRVVRKVEAMGLTFERKACAEMGWTLQGHRGSQSGTYRLESPEGTPFARPSNADNLKKYYV